MIAMYRAAKARVSEGLMIGMLIAYEKNTWKRLNSR